MSNPTAKLMLQVEGIRCANCALSIERKLGALQGVTRIRTNVAEKRVVVDHNADLSDAEILQCLADQGYEAVVGSPQAEAKDDESKQLLARMGVAGIGMMQVMMFALANYVAGSGGLEPAYQTLMNWASFALATPVALYSAWPFHKGAVTDLKHWRLGMDVPVSLAIVAAYALSSLHMFTGGEVYFDTVCMFAFLLLIGRFLELRSRQQYQQSVSLAERCLPESAFVVEESCDVPVQSIAAGTLVRVAAGDIMPVDGIVESGAGAVSEAAFTGESDSIRKQVGSKVLAGSINVEAELLVRSSVTADEFVIAKLSELHQEAMLYKPDFSRLADIVARYFIAGVLLLAAATGLYWYMAGDPDWFVIMITVLVVSCPCALSLATPVAYTVAVTSLKRHGVVVSAGKFLEQLANITHIVFDKTGTLTEGKLKVAHIELLAEGADESDVLNLCAALERHSRHPIARAFETGLALVAENIEEVSGQGVSGLINQRQYRLGKSSFAAPESAPTVPAGMGTWVLLASEAPIAWICLQDEVRDNSKQLVQALGRDYELSLLSGDREQEVQRVSELVGIAAASGDLSPDEKLHRLRAYQADGHRVLMVGDGVNDAAAMGVADAAVAVSPVDILVQEAADATLLRQDILRLTTLIDYSKRLKHIIRQNISWAVLYNISVMPLAVAGVLEPWMAALGMSLSSLLVVANANRLIRVEKN